MSGCVYNFEVDGSPESKGLPENTNPPSKRGKSDFAVMRLTKGLEKNEHFVFYDNYFSLPELAVYLKRKGVWAVSTLDRKRNRKCLLPSKKECNKLARGTIIEVTDPKKQVVITTWIDNKPVLMLSNFVGKERVDQCKRFDRKEKKNIEVERPAAVATYNKCIGGVDKMDMLFSLYRSNICTRKWYLRIAFHLFGLAAVNSWILYKELGGSNNLLIFLTELSIDLFQGRLPIDTDTDTDSDEVEEQKQKFFLFNLYLTSKY